MQGSGRIKILLIVTFLALAGLGHAQKGIIRGFVYEKESGEPVIFTNVYLKGTTLGAASDVNGFYTITKVPPGSYTLLVTYLGFDTLSMQITIVGDEIVSKQLYLTKSAVTMKEVEISGEKQEAQTQVKVSVNKITAKELKLLPTVGGEPDIAQYLQVLPGVVFTGDQGGQLYIRGGSPVQNKVLLDGMIVYNPFHSIGLFSVFDSDIIRNADVYSGGFGAKYGGRISSVMDITTRDGNKKNLAGKLSVSPFGAKAIIEGPLKKAETEGDGTISYVFSAKNSYLDRSSKLFYTWIDSAGLPFTYTDLYGKVSFNGVNGSKANFFGFNFTDQVKYKAVSDLNWKTFGLGSNFVLVPTGSRVLVEGNVAYSQYGISMDELNLPTRSSNINSFNLGFDFKYFMGEDEAKYGVEILGYSTEFDFFNEVGRRIEQNENTTEIAGYFSYKKTIGRLILEPSFRAHYYASLSQFSPEPRLGAKYNLNEFFRLKFAGGLYSQNLISANSDRDVVNLFYGFLAGPDNLQGKFTTQNGNVRDVTHQLQKATHAIGGFEVDITENLNLNVEAYYKYFNQLTNMNRNKIFDEGEIGRPDVLKKDFIVETGDAMGLDFVLKYEKKRIYLWAVYSLSKVTRWDGLQVYAPVFDRRHNINLVASYSFGKDNAWGANARWNLGSGLPFTQTEGFFERFNFQDGIGQDYVSTNGGLGIVYATLNGGRLPTYHRLDLMVKRLFKLKGKSEIEANAGVTNAYNRENIFYFNRVSYERVNQLPIMPSFGVNWSF